MIEKNFTLLTQSEIDTLVGFLQEQKDGVADEVLSQESIDKVISMIQQRQTRHFAQNNKFWVTDAEQYLITVGFRRSREDLCELRFRMMENDYIELYAYNHETGDEFVLTPEDFSDPTTKNDTSIGWGICIMPAFFDQVAELFSLRYTKDTYIQICELFAERNFGKTNIEIPAAFLCDGTLAIDRLL